MPDYNAQIQGPDLRGLSQGVAPVNTSSSSAATANLVGTLAQLGAKAYGTYAAKKAGNEIGGNETYEAAGIAADQAKQELEGLSTTKASEQGHDITMDQARDLKDAVFGKVLSNQKRIQSALSRGLITSTEATARLSVLRNEALSNPLIAPYQDQLDNALYTTTGGAGNTFSSTAQELAAQAKQKGALAATEETQKQVTSMIQTGIAANEKQALNYIAQTEEQKRQIEFLAYKKSQLSLTSQEVYASNQIFQTQQAASAFSIISSFQNRGGLANEKQSVQLQLVRDGEMTKQAIRAQAFDKKGNLLVEPDQLASQISEVDKRVQEFSKMIDDQSGTKKLQDQVAQMTSAMDLKGTTIQVDLAKRLPLLYALKDSPIIQKWYIDNVTDTNKLATNWQTATNPIKRMLASYPISELNDKVSTANESFLGGGAPDNVQGQILSDTLTARGATAAVDKAHSDHPDETLKNLSNIPFTIKSIANNDEWKRRASTPEGVDQLAAIVEGAASRALVSSIYEPDRQGAYAPTNGVRNRYQLKPGFAIPEEVSVVRNEKPAVVVPKGYGGRGSGNNVGKKYEEWTIDTKGVIVSNAYKSELVNAYKLGTEQPAIWNEDFKSIDEWLNHLFARPKGAQ